MIKTVVKIEPGNEQLFIETAKKFLVEIEASQNPDDTNYFEITTEYEHTIFNLGDSYGYAKGIRDYKAMVHNVINDTFK